MSDALCLSHVADRYKCYAGDFVTFSTRVTVKQPGSTYTLAIDRADGLELDRFTQQPNLSTHTTTRHHAADQLLWHVEQAEHSTDYEVKFRISHASHALLEKMTELTDDLLDRQPEKRDYIELHSQATLVDLKTEQQVSETVVIRVYRQASYLQYLPAIYENEALLSQFLIFFERYWQPIQQQLDHIEDNFDPMLAPAALLPWLAAWFDWAFEEDWPLDAGQREAWRRKMLHYKLPTNPTRPKNEPNFRTVLHLHRKRGTAEGLKTYLELYTRGEVEITSYTEHPLQLDGTAQLGRGIALYDQPRQPHTFDVKVTLPAAMTATTSFDIKLVEEKVRAIIAAEKPAHTRMTKLTIN